MRKTIVLFWCLLHLGRSSAFHIAPLVGVRSRQESDTKTSLDAAIVSGDKVVIFGGTGGVGQLVTKKLRNLDDDISVRIAARSAESAKETIDDDQVEILEVDLLAEDDTTQLESALDGVSAVIISVGTTAFPTLTWRGGNTPDAIDNRAVTRIAQVATKLPALKRIMLLTSVGVDRTSEMPFVILNLFGVLDAKRNGEIAVKQAAQEAGFDYVIVRPGRLVGGPYTNIDFVRLLKIEGGAENGVTVAKGDELLGDCKRDACAEAVVQCLTNEKSGNLEISIISNEDKALTNSEWDSLFERIQG